MPSQGLGSTVPDARQSTQTSHSVSCANLDDLYFTSGAASERVRLPSIVRGITKNREDKVTVTRQDDSMRLDTRFPIAPSQYSKPVYNSSDFDKNDSDYDSLMRKFGEVAYDGISHIKSNNNKLILSMQAKHRAEVAGLEERRRLAVKAYKGRNRLANMYRKSAYKAKGEIWSVREENYTLKYQAEGRKLDLRIARERRSDLQKTCQELKEEVGLNEQALTEAARGHTNLLKANLRLYNKKVRELEETDAELERTKEKLRRTEVELKSKNEEIAVLNENLRTCHRSFHTHAEGDAPQDLDYSESEDRPRKAKPRTFADLSAAKPGQFRGRVRNTTEGQSGPTLDSATATPAAREDYGNHKPQLGSRMKVTCCAVNSV